MKNFKQKDFWGKHPESHPHNLINISENKGKISEIKDQISEVVAEILNDSRQEEFQFNM